MSVEEGAMTYEQAVKEVWVWQYSNTGSFYSQLCTAWQKADPKNRARLFQAFPQLCEAMNDWEAAEEPANWFRKYLGQTVKV